MRRAFATAVVLTTVAALAGGPAWPRSLPQLKLADPLGTEFTHAQLAAHGAVVVVSAPSYSQGSKQQAWSDAFSGLERGAAGPALVFLEDMSQSAFRPLVLSRMKAVYQPARHVLLLDEDGRVRESLGVGEDATVAFAFGPGGTLRAVETGAASAERAQALIEAARGR